MDFDFSDRDRAVFQYHDGAKKVFGDPLELDRRVRVKLTNPRKVVEEIARLDLNQADGLAIHQALQRQEALVLAVREAFRMVDFDGATNAGATDSMVLAVWNHFCEFMSKKNGTGASAATSSPPTASPSKS